MDNHKEKICIDIKISSGKRKKNFKCCAYGDYEKLDSHKKIKRFVDNMVCE